MRKWMLPLLCVWLVMVSGCGNTRAPAPPTAVNFTCDFTATYREMEFAGKLERAAAGMLTVSLTKPAALNGLTLTWDGEGARVSLGLLHYTMDATLPQSGFGKLLLNVLDAAFCENMAGRLTEIGAQFTGKTGQYDYTLLCEPETGTLLSLQVPDAALSVHFSDLRAAK